MKRYLKIFILAVTLLIAPVFLFADGPGDNPPPLPGGGSGGTNPPPGTQVGAPVGDGILFLVTLALLYGSRKKYRMRKETTTVEA